MQPRACSAALSPFKPPDVHPVYVRVGQRQRQREGKSIEGPEGRHVHSIFPHQDPRRTVLLSWPSLCICAAAGVLAGARDHDVKVQKALLGLQPMKQGPALPLQALHQLRWQGEHCLCF